MLEWQRHNYDPAKGFEPGTELSYAYAGNAERFIVVEVRDWIRDGEGYYAGSVYEVRDSAKREHGQDIRGPVVFRHGDYRECEAFCKAADAVPDALPVFVVSMIEYANGDTGRVHYEIKARSGEDALRIARERFAGNRGVNTLELE